MKNFNFLITDDNSVGLYNTEVKDIYHSRSGAYKEAYDKFVEPILSLNTFKNRNKIKVLDICYGIGYNTKCLLNTIDSCIQIEIDALEYDKNLVCLSPLIKDNIKDDELKIFLIYQLLKNDINIVELENIIQNTNNDFLTQNICNIIKKMISQGYKYNPQDDYNSFLHNIYYNYISYSMNNGLKSTKYTNSSINYYFDDARKTIKLLNNTYDIVFLDAFSSQKDPTLWTIHFLSEVKSKMNDNSVLVSYSKSTPFRSALIELGFYVGKTFLDGVDMGTIASINKENIINTLSDYDLELLSTRSGITFKDENLNLSGTKILGNREIEQKTSSRMSHTAFLKKYSK